MLPETTKAPDTRFDIAGSVLLAAALVAFLVAVERGRTWGWTSLPTFGVFGCAVLCGVAFSRVEKSVEHPLVPLKYFRTRNFTVPIVVLFFAQFGYMGGFILAPKLLDQIGGMSTTRVSSLLVARPITFAVAGVCAGLLARRLGIRKIAVTGVLLVVASLIVMSYVATSLSEIAVVLAVAISGLGVGMSQPTIAASIANSVDDADLGVAGATQQLALQVSTSVGMNLLDALQASFAVSVALSVSYQRSYLIAAAITALGVLAAFALPARVVDGRPNDRRTRGGRSAVAPRPR
jgi:predicted MFS family arabinose efflux permease